MNKNNDTIGEIINIDMLYLLGDIDEYEYFTQLNKLMKNLKLDEREKVLEMLGAI